MKNGGKNLPGWFPGGLSVPKEKWVDHGTHLKFGNYTICHWHPFFLLGDEFRNSSMYLCSAKQEKNGLYIRSHPMLYRNPVPTFAPEIKVLGFNLPSGSPLQLDCYLDFPCTEIQVTSLMAVGPTLRQGCLSLSLARRTTESQSEER